jgi:hypothetical protein
MMEHHENSCAKKLSACEGCGEHFYLDEIEVH